MSTISLQNIRHPLYVANSLDWTKYRFAYEGGSAFKERYLSKFSKREDNEDFKARKAMSYSPSFARIGIEDVKNSIFQRMTDIVRTGGPSSYTDTIGGSNGGVDLKRNSMTSFMGIEVLPELLLMGKVGVYIDKQPSRGPTLFDNRGNRPYLYTYTAENIYSWRYNQNQELDAVLLSEQTHKYDKATGLPTGYETIYRRLWKSDDGVHVEVYEESGLKPIEEYVLELDTIPFVMIELSNSLMVDIADYQIALLNLASSDMAYALSANFPFYVEQSNLLLDFAHQMSGGTPSPNNDGTQTEAGVADVAEVQVGSHRGRRYAQGMDAPQFIFPSPEPMKASMAKQEQLKEEIRLLLNLTISNLKPVRATAESKQTDDRTLENGLSYIGLELEYAERQIGDIWSQYEGMKSNPPHIKYPDNYQLRSDAERRAEAKDVLELLPKVPSQTFQKVMSKSAVRVLLGGRVPASTLDMIEKELDSAKVVYSDPEKIWKDIENGIVSKQLASELFGYPKGEVEVASEEHAHRASMIALAQAKANAEASSHMGARGVGDLSTDPTKDGAEEKKKSLDTSLDPTVKKKVRGAGK